ncbi:MAG: hypothetical protein KAG56_05850 [Sulfurovaceae bacterium]|nr:hypothetical protein [Sulfurovaceae bacterium]
MAYKKSLKIIKTKILEKERLKKRIKQYHNLRPLEFEHLEEMDNCLCTDSKHQFKDIYLTEHEAEQQAKYLNDMQGVQLFVYPCPYNAGWHLTQR